jgi:LPS export ABC transporter protein LptC
MARTAGIVFSLIAVAWMVYTLFGSDQQPRQSQETVIVTEPDIYGVDVLFNQLRPDGSLHYRLNATAIRQFSKDQLTRMTDPQLHLINPDQPPWDINANHGYIRKRSDPAGVPEDVVYLREQVLMTQRHPERGQLTMRSESFYIYPDRQFAETDQDVMIDTEVGRTKAAGLQADLETGLLTLTSKATQRVHTIVLPEQFKKTS